MDGLQLGSDTHHTIQDSSWAGAVPRRRHTGPGLAAGTGSRTGTPPSARLPGHRGRLPGPRRGPWALVEEYRCRSVDPA